MHKENWVYQARPVNIGEYPWAVLIDIDYQPTKRKETIELNFSIYSERIENPLHSISVECGHKEHVSDYVSLLISNLGEYSEVTSIDVDQITNAILDALIH